MKSINHTLMLTLSLTASVIFVLAVLVVGATVQLAGWNPSRICRTAISIISQGLTRAPTPASHLVFSEAGEFSALSARSADLWFAAWSGADSFEFNRDRRPRLPFEISGGGISTKSAVMTVGAGQVLCLEEINRPAEEPFILMIANARPSIAMTMREFLKRGFPVIAMVGIAFATIVVVGVYLAGRFVRVAIARVTKMALAIDPAAPQGSIPLHETPLELQPLVTSLNGAFDEIASFIERERRFLGNVAHELRTPLAILRTKLEGVDDRRLRAALVLDTRRLASLVAAMLDLSRLRITGFREKRVDLADVTRDVLADYGPLALDQGITLSLVADCNEPIMVLGSKEAIRSAIANLVGNALVHARGTRTIAARLSRRGSVSICDDGRSARDEESAKPAARTTSAVLGNSGIGLGLSIVREIMAAHQGTLSITPTPGGGTSVHLLFGIEPTVRSSA